MKREKNLINIDIHKILGQTNDRWIKQNNGVLDLKIIRKREKDETNKS